MVIKKGSHCRGLGAQPPSAGVWRRSPQAARGLRAQPPKVRGSCGAQRPGMQKVREAASPGTVGESAGQRSQGSVNYSGNRMTDNLHFVCTAEVATLCTRIGAEFSAITKSDYALHHAFVV